MPPALIAGVAIAVLVTAWLLWRFARRPDVPRTQVASSAQAEIERHLHWSAGRLTKLLAGTNELRLRNFLEILRTIDVDPWDYYRLVCGKTKLSEHVVHKLEAAKPKTEPVVLPPAISETELNRRIQEAVDRALDLRLKKVGI